MPLPDLPLSSTSPFLRIELQLLTLSSLLASGAADNTGSKKGGTEKQSQFKWPPKLKNKIMHKTRL